MQSTKKCLALVIPLLALAGCAALDQVAKDVQKATAPVMLTESLPQICQAAKDNQVRAKGSICFRCQK